MYPQPKEPKTACRTFPELKLGNSNYVLINFQNLNSISETESGLARKYAKRNNLKLAKTDEVNNFINKFDLRNILNSLYPENVCILTAAKQVDIPKNETIISLINPEEWEKKRESPLIIKGSIKWYLLRVS